MKTLSDAESLLEWVKVNNWLMQTTCGRYRCRKFYSGDVLNHPGEERYQVRNARGLTCGPPQVSFAAARAVAERDAK